MIAPSSREPVETTDADFGAWTCLVDTEFALAPDVRSLRFVAAPSRAATSARAELIPGIGQAAWAGAALALGCSLAAYLMIRERAVAN